ncbi:MAG: PP2C family protein-serine/threonine phosphatase, partial [Candidatus Competibacterales bacterium]
MSDPPSAPEMGSNPRLVEAVAVQLGQDFEPVLDHLRTTVEPLLAAVAPTEVELTSDLERLLAAEGQLRQRLRSAAAGGETRLDALRHDLRGGLGGIKGLVELLLEDADSRPGDALDLAGPLGAIAEDAVKLLGSLEQLAPSAQASRVAASAIAATAHRTKGQGVDPRGIAILAVDDNTLNQLLLRRQLEAEGYGVEVAASGAAALALLEGRSADQDPIHLVLLDVLMPEMNGFEVLQRLKNHPRLRELPVIMISAWNDLSSITRCIEHGAEDYLLKPWEPALLRARINSVLEQRRLQARERELLQREIDQAIALQKSLMPPPSPPESPIHGRNRPVRYVSGDFFDYFCRGDGTMAFAVADVSGKGFDAALLMAKVAGLFRYLAKSSTDPGALLQVLNTELYSHDSPRRFVTAVVGFYRPATGQLTFANAGHVPPLCLTSAGEVERFPATAPPLGALAAARYGTQSLTLAPGAVLYLPSDGFIDCLEPNGQALELEGLVALLRACRGLALHRQLDWVFEWVTSPGWETRDDLTLLALGYPEG